MGVLFTGMAYHWTKSFLNKRNVINWWQEVTILLNQVSKELQSIYLCENVSDYYGRVCRRYWGSIELKCQSTKLHSMLCVGVLQGFNYGIYIFLSHFQNSGYTVCVSDVKLVAWVFFSPFVSCRFLSSRQFILFRILSLFTTLKWHESTLSNHLLSYTIL